MNYKQKTLCTVIATLLTPAANANVIANDDVVSMEQSAGSITIDVLANDSTDQESQLYVDDFDSLTAAYGSVVLNENGTLVYTPSNEFLGEDTFTYAASDSSCYGSELTAVPNTESLGENRVFSLADGQEPFCTGTATVSITVLPDFTNDSEEAPELVLTDLNGFASAVKGQNIKAIAPLTQQVCANSTETPTGCETLQRALTVDRPELQKLAEQLTPDEYLMQRRLLSEVSRGRTSRIYRHLSQLKSSPNTGIASQQIGGFELGGSAGDGLSSPIALFGSVFIENTDYTQTDLEPGYEAEGTGGLIGVNYRLSNAISLGAAYDYTSYDIEFNKDNNSTATQGQSLTGFVSWYNNALSVEAQLGLSNTSLESERFVSLPTNTLLTSEVDAKERNASVQFNWQTQQASWGFTPFLRFDYQHLAIDEFSEVGNSIWAMSAAKQVLEELNTSVGLDTSYTYNADWGVFIPGFKLSLISKNQLDDEVVSFNLAQLQSSTVNLNADTTGRLFSQADITGIFVLPNGVSFFGAASIVEASDNMSGYQVNIGLNIEI